MLDPVLLRENLCALMEECSDCYEDAAYKWKEAIRTYSENVIPTSTTVNSAASTLETELMAAFILKVEASAEMELAFANFANAIATGMLPAYVGTPPSGSVGFYELFTMAFPDTCSEGAQRFATAIDNWIKTGTATPSGGGSPINWS